MAITQNIVIREFPHVPVIYGRVCEDFVTATFPGWDQDGVLQWKDMYVVCVPQLLPQYGLHCIGASGSFACATSTDHTANQDRDVINAAMANLRAVVGSIQAAEPLPTTVALEELLRRAVQSQGTPGNIEEWSRQLAQDVGTLTD